jgi:hypothetical protein
MTQPWRGFLLDLYFALGLVLLTTASARADEGAIAAPSTPALEAPTPPAPYVAPWLLRPMVAINVARWDNSLALYESPTTGLMAATYVSSFFGGYKIPGTGGPTEGVQLVARLTVAYDNPPQAQSAAIFANPVFGGTYARRLPRGFRLHTALSFTLPVGMGGGDTPNAAESAVRAKAQLARLAMDNSVFAVNDLAIIPGAAVAWVDRGWTVQAEATLFFLPRVRGAESQKEAFKVNFTTGLFAGYFVVPKYLSLGVELHYQRYFLGPNSIKTAPATVDNVSLAGGVRFHVPVGKHWLRCGVSYGGGLDSPLTAGHYSVTQFDCPFVF